MLVDRNEQYKLNNTNYMEAIRHIFRDSGSINRETNKGKSLYNVMQTYRNSIEFHQRPFESQTFSMGKFNRPEDKSASTSMSTMQALFEEEFQFTDPNFFETRCPHRNLEDEVRTYRTIAMDGKLSLAKQFGFALQSFVAGLSAFLLSQDQEANSKFKTDLFRISGYVIMCTSLCPALNLLCLMFPHRSNDDNLFTCLMSLVIHVVSGLATASGMIVQLLAYPLPALLFVTIDGEYSFEVLCSIFISLVLLAKYALAASKQSSVCKYSSITLSRARIYYNRERDHLFINTENEVLQQKIMDLERGEQLCLACLFSASVLILCFSIPNGFFDVIQSALVLEFLLETDEFMIEIVEQTRANRKYESFINGDDYFDALRRE